jgi:hypothetical protein
MKEERKWTEVAGPREKRARKEESQRGTRFREGGSWKVSTLGR